MLLYTGYFNILLKKTKTNSAIVEPLLEVENDYLIINGNFTNQHIVLQYRFYITVVHCWNCSHKSAQATATVHDLEEITARLFLTNPIYEKICFRPKRSKTISSPSTSETYLEIKGWGVNVQSLTANWEKQANPADRNSLFECKITKKPNEFKCFTIRLKTQFMQMCLSFIITVLATPQFHIELK